MTSKERREKGMLFIADEQDWVEMKNARKLLQTLNNMDRSDFSGINSLVRELLGRADESTFLNPPFFCDYGSNIFVGKNCFINYKFFPVPFSGLLTTPSYSPSTENHKYSSL